MQWQISGVPQTLKKALFDTAQNCGNRVPEFALAIPQNRRIVPLILWADMRSCCRLEAFHRRARPQYFNFKAMVNRRCLLAQFISILNFEKFQHYRDRKPPWIKLYRDLLSDDRLFDLSEADRYQLIGLFIIASQHDNRIPNKPAWLRKELAINRPISLQKLIDTGWIQVVEQDASIPLAASSAIASCKQETIVEKRRDREETETEGIPPPEKRGGRIDLAANSFSVSYGIYRGNPYGWFQADFVQLAALRKRLRLESDETPFAWESALLNYFTSPLPKYSLKHFAADYDTFKDSPLDRYGKPINHINSNGDNGNGKHRETHNDKDNRAIKAFLDRSLAPEMQSDLPDVREEP